MILADCLVFPKPSYNPSKRIQRKVIYIPKNTEHHHYYTTTTVNPTKNTTMNTHNNKNNKNNSQDQFIQSINNIHSNYNTNSTRSYRSNNNNEKDHIQNVNCQQKSNKNKIYAKDTNKKIKTIKYQQETNSNNQYIPCLFFSGKVTPEKLIVYFHSNAEDLATAHDFVRSIGNYTGQSILLVQYPGYSLYTNGNNDEKQAKGNNSNDKNNMIVTKAQTIQNDAIKIIKYVRKVGYCIGNITAMGRSIGSGPAVYLASIYPLRALVLLSPFLSLCRAVSDLYGPLASSLLKQRFNNKQRAQYILCPTLLIHGKQDRMISYKHSIQLSEIIKGYCSVKIVQDMTHCSFRLYEDFVRNLGEFYKQIEG